MRLVSRAALSAVLMLLAAPALSQERQSRGYSNIIDNVDVLMRSYTSMLERKYDLTDEQAQYTRDMLQRRVDQFLGEHEGRLRVLVDELYDVRQGGEMSPDELVTWGEEIRPIFEDAKEMIISGNDEWRGILTERQRAIHDRDLELMYQSFEITTDQLDRIVAGEMSVDEFRRGPNRRRPQRKPVAREPVSAQDRAVITETEAQKAREAELREKLRSVEDPAVRAKLKERLSAEQAKARKVEDAQSNLKERQRRGTAKRTPPNQASNSKATPRTTHGKRTTKTQNRRGSNAQVARDETAWEKYVREYCDRYKFNDAQRQKADQILRDCEQAAERVMRAAKPRIEQIDDQLQKLAKDTKAANAAQQRTRLSQQKDRLLAPLEQIFNKNLKPRLERLPTRAQRAAVESGADKSDKSKRSSNRKKKGDE